MEYEVDAGLEAVLVPSLILQPLVENAIRHSVARLERGGRIRISARGEGDRLRLQVEDDGPGPGAGPPHKGVGLGNTEARLAQMYGDRSGLQFARTDAGGFAVCITIPMEAVAS